MTTVDKEAEAGAAAETEREDIMAFPAEEALTAVEEATEITTSTTMEEETVAASMETESTAEGIMDTTATSTRRINNILSHISNNKCLRQFIYLIPRPVLGHTSRTTTWTAMPIRQVTTPTVANGTTKGNNGHD